MRLLPGLLLLCSAVSAQTVIYVDADAAGANNGSSWSDAFDDLQDGLAAASTGDEIWIAEGLYTPTNNTDRSFSFVLQDGIALFGGFNGTESSRDERDWDAFESILSGDIGVPGDSTDNSYHVIVANAVGKSTIIDGITIQNGTARGGSAPDDRGAGVLAINGSPTIRNTNFLRNVIGNPPGGARLGGGIYVENGEPSIEDCHFEDNSANGGGGAYFSNSNPVMRRVTMSDNTATALTFVYGSTGTLEDIVVERGRVGASIREGSSPVFRRCTFRQHFNDPGDEGGGVSMDDSNPVFEDCLFEDNQGASGAGVSVEGGSIPLFIRTTFRENVATSTGGAVNSTLSAPTFIGCTFDRNTGLGAGAIRAASSSVTLIGSVLTGNVSTIETGDVGGLQLNGSTWQGMPSLVANTLFVGNEGASGGALLAVGINPGDALIVNSTFASNVARENGGAVYAFLAEDLEFNNVILWGNEAPNDPEIHIDTGGPPTVERAIVAGGYPSGIDILDQDPLFVRPPDPGSDGAWGTDDDDYGDLRLLESSPGIDFGLTSFLPADIWDLDGDGNTTEPLPIDLNGDVRVQGGSVDLGAYEGPGVVKNTPNVPEPHQSGLRVFPNPATATITIEGDVDSEIIIIDVLGRRVLTARSDNRATSIDITALPQGVYVVRTGNQSRTITVRR